MPLAEVASRAVRWMCLYKMSVISLVRHIYLSPTLTVVLASRSPPGLCRRRRRLVEERDEASLSGTHG